MQHPSREVKKSMQVGEKKGEDSKPKPEGTPVHFLSASKSTHNQFKTIRALHEHFGEIRDANVSRFSSVLASQLRGSWRGGVLVQLSVFAIMVAVLAVMAPHISFQFDWGSWVIVNYRVAVPGNTLEVTVWTAVIMVGLFHQWVVLLFHMVVRMAFVEGLSEGLIKQYDSQFKTYAKLRAGFCPAPGLAEEEKEEEEDDGVRRNFCCYVWNSDQSQVVAGGALLMDNTSMNSFYGDSPSPLASSSCSSPSDVCVVGKLSVQSEHRKTHSYDQDVLAKCIELSRAYAKKKLVVRCLSCDGATIALCKRMKLASRKEHPPLQLSPDHFSRMQRWVADCTRVAWVDFVIDLTSIKVT